VFVGAGAVAEKYAADLGDSPLSLQGVADVEGDRARALAETHGASACTDLDAMLSAESAPLVVNLTSQRAHAEITRRSLEADRHVFSEKPLALSVSAARELIELAERRDLGLDVAPINDRGPAQQHASRLLADGRFGEIQLGYAHAHVGRVTDWHERPASFLSVGPLYDGAVYPLTLLVSWFGPVERVRSATAVDAWPDRETETPDGPAHVEASLAFRDGPVVRLTASFYVSHRSREFNSLELHGDDGSLYLEDTGALEYDSELVQVGGSGREYVPAPDARPAPDRRYLDGAESLARAINNGVTVGGNGTETERKNPANEPAGTGDGHGKRRLAGARRAAHVVAVCNAIERAAGEDGGKRQAGIDDFGLGLPGLESPSVRPAGNRETAVSTEAGSQSERARGRAAAIRLPPVGFGCSRYRDGTYVDRIDSIATAIDAGYRLFDSAELYGNEERIGSLLAQPGSPHREGLFLVGKVWNTNHEHVAEACEGSLAALGIEAFDCYMLHWPESWGYQGPLRNLAALDPDEQAARTFPTDESGDPLRTDVALTDTWERLEALHDRGLTRTLGVANVDRDQLETIVSNARIQPAVVQIEAHPYMPRQPLVDACHDLGIRVMAHSPLSAPGLLQEDILLEIGERHGVSAAGVVLAWNVARGVVPIPSSNDTDHIVENLAAATIELTPAELTSIDDLADPSFER
jgi:alcohol dehydrogenase (NADP+)